MHRLILIPLSVLLMAIMAGAQTQEQSWDNLKTLRQEEKIQVVDWKLKSQNGTFVSFSDEAITFQAGKDAVTLQRADVFRVSSQKGMGRGKHALIGLGVGAAIGAGLGAATDGGDLTRGDAAGMAAFLGGVTGAGVGALVPASRPTIYRAERREVQVAP